MAHKDEVELLRKRALDFLRTAEEKVVDGSYDIACFLSEQAVQLYIKSLILELFGEMPRTHSIRDLLGLLYEELGRDEIKGFLSKNRQGILSLEGSYVMARYLYRRYSREEAEDLVKLANEVIRLAEDIKGSKGKD
jgi:HEPN domain-containing protein